MIDTLNARAVDKEGLIAYWRMNPVQASKDILGVDLDKHQRITLNQMWRNDEQTNILSRGTGKTFLLAVCASLEGILKAEYKIGLIAPSFRQSKLIFEEIHRLWERSHVFQESVYDRPVYRPEKCYLKFKAASGRIGTTIEALPMGADGSKLRGSRYFSTYVDEAAQLNKEILDVVVRGFMATSANPMENVRLIREMEELVKAGVITQDQMLNPPANKMVFSTTAYYQYNHAWERVSKLVETLTKDKKHREKNGQDTSHFKFSGGPLNEGQIPYRVLSDGKSGLCVFTCMDPSKGFMNMASIEKSKIDMTDYQFRMEYFAYFPPDSEGFYRRHILDKCRTHCEFGPILEPRKGYIYTMGVDPARTSDNFAIAVYEIDPDSNIVRLVRVLSWNKKDFPLMNRKVREVIKLYGIEYFEMDAGGGGTTVRDLLASKENTPDGESLILEQQFDEHKTKVGVRMLGPLVQFSSYEWVRDANNNLLSALEHGRLQIAATPPVAGQLWTPALDEADEEMEKALTEMSSVIKTSQGQRERWDTPTPSMRKDRYSAILIGYNAALKLLNKKPKTLCGGFFA